MFRILDKYLVKEFLTPFIYCIFAFVILFVVGDLFENLDDFIQQDASLSIILRYYMYSLPTIFIWTSPLAVLLALLYQLGYMKRYNEMEALKASGISFMRIVFPFIIVGAIISLAVFFISENLVPKCSRITEGIKSEYVKGDKEVKEKVIRQITFFNKAKNTSLYIDKVSPDKKNVEEVSLREFFPNGKLKRERFGKRGVWLDGNLWLMDGYIRRFRLIEDKQIPAGPVDYFIKHRTNFNITLKDLIKIQEESEFMNQQMSLKQLYLYIRKTYTAETLPHRLLVEFYRKFSVPFSMLVVVIMGIAFGSKISKGGALASVGASIGFYIIYYGISSFLVAMGRTGRILPAIAVWVPQILFLLIGSWMLSQAK